MEFAIEILGTLNMKAGDLTMEAGYFAAAFLLLAGMVLWLRLSNANAGSLAMSAGVVLGLTIFFFVQRDKSGNSFGAINALLPLLLAFLGATFGLFLKKHFVRPGRLKRLNIFNLSAGSISFLICITGFARTHHNAVLISAFGVFFALVAIFGTLIILRKKPQHLAQSRFFLATSTPFLLLFISSMAVSLTGYIVVSTPMILSAVALAALGLSISLQQSSGDDSRLKTFLQKQAAD
jgi:hypothetical protein